MSKHNSNDYNIQAYHPSTSKSDKQRIDKYSEKRKSKKLDSSDSDDDAQGKYQKVENFSDTSSGSKSNERCAICLGRINGFFGSPDAVGCDHYFCLLCILEWSKNNTTCPQDRRCFNKILVRNSVGGNIVNKIPVEVRKEDDLAGAFEDNPTFCEVCGSSEREDCLLLCDGCDLGFHMECLTPPLADIPIEEWFCPTCEAADIPKVVSHAATVTKRNDEKQSETPLTEVSSRTRARMIPRTRATERILERISTTRKREKKKKKRLKKRRQRFSGDQNCTAESELFLFSRAKPFGSIGDTDIDAHYNDDDMAERLLYSGSIAVKNEGKKSRAPTVACNGRSFHHSVETSPVPDMLSNILENQSVLLARSADIRISDDRKLLKNKMVGEINSLMSIPLPSDQRSDKYCEDEIYDPFKEYEEERVRSPVRDYKYNKAMDKHGKKRGVGSNTPMNRRGSDKIVESSNKDKEGYYRQAYGRDARHAYQNPSRRRSRSRSHGSGRTHHRRSRSRSQRESSSRSHRRRSKSNDRGHKSFFRRSEPKEKRRRRRRSRSDSRERRRQGRESQDDRHRGRHTSRSSEERSSVKDRKLLENVFDSDGSSTSEPNRQSSSPSTNRSKSNANDSLLTREYRNIEERIVERPNCTSGKWGILDLKSKIKLLTEKSEMKADVGHSSKMTESDGALENDKRRSAINFELKVKSRPEKADVRSKSNRLKEVFGEGDEELDNNPHRMKPLPNSNPLKKLLDEESTKTDEIVEGRHGNPEGAESPYDPCQEIETTIPIDLESYSPLNPSAGDSPGMENESFFDEIMSSVKRKKDTVASLSSSPSEEGEDLGESFLEEKVFDEEEIGIESSDKSEVEEKISSASQLRSPIAPISEGTPVKDEPSSVAESTMDENGLIDFSEDTIAKISEKNRELILKSVLSKNRTPEKQDVSPSKRKGTKSHRKSSHNDSLLENEKSLYDQFASPVNYADSYSDEVIRRKLKKIDENINKENSSTYYKSHLYEQLFGNNENNEFQTKKDEKKKEEVNVRIKEIKETKESVIPVSHASIRERDILDDKALKSAKTKGKKMILEAKVVEEAKRWLNPYYQDKSLTKEEYKEIIIKIVNKVLSVECGMKVEPRKIKKLVDGYVTKLLHERKKKNKTV